jgi:hypothetical protein
MYDHVQVYNFLSLRLISWVLTRTIQSRQCELGRPLLEVSTMPQNHYALIHRTTFLWVSEITNNKDIPRKLTRSWSPRISRNNLTKKLLHRVRSNKLRLRASHPQSGGRSFIAVWVVDNGTLFWGGWGIIAPAQRNVSEWSTNWRAVESILKPWWGHRKIITYVSLLLTR